MDHHQLICEALRQSHSIRKLKLHILSVVTLASQSFAATLPHLNQLRDLEFKHVRFDRTFAERLSELLSRTASLTTLTMSYVWTTGEGMLLVLEALKLNETITTLSLDSWFVLTLAKWFPVIFADYLRENRTLRTLSVISFSNGFQSWLRLMTESLLPNTTLSKLNLVQFRLDVEGINLITEFLRQNQTLRSFNLKSCVWPSSQYGADTYISFGSCGKVSSLIYPWLVALNENKTLEELTVDLSWCNTDECRSLFRALSNNVCLKKFTVEDFGNNDMVEICKAFREAGLQERIFIPRHHVGQGNTVAFNECTELSSIKIDSAIFHGFDQLLRALRLLPSCNHVRSLFVVVSDEMFNATVSSLIGQYITATRALRELELQFQTGVGFRTWNAVDRGERALVQALSVNKSIHRLSIIGLCFDEAETQMLVNTLRSSQTLCDMTFYPGHDSSTALLVKNLSPNFAKNFTILHMRVTWNVDVYADCFAMARVASRNSSLVTRAAHFVMGGRRKYCAAAIELVHFTPGLVARVQELASVDEDEAVLRIKKSRNRFSELDDFMRMAGVVKDRVTCHRRDDGQMQLVDLNRDCWLYLRRFLKVGDIPDAH
ncbi:hypothetical protein HPB52_008479 [Rhipicephalus sanguineus]|uniref:Nlr family card domain protein n=1 Tax=Rhipicephalus sanguineus TaxID=34632 RepID=A0A9D4PIL1_RHISA|nr:hypothetical protein HPB52_008479 [Rhipicephalus sanguineus]